ERAWVRAASPPAQPNRRHHLAQGRRDVRVVRSADSVVEDTAEIKAKSRCILRAGVQLSQRTASFGEEAVSVSAGDVRVLDDSRWAIECRGLKKAFGAHTVLDGMDFGVPRGSITVVLGPSGTGKSVLLKHLI